MDAMRVMTPIPSIKRERGKGEGRARSALTSLPPMPAMRVRGAAGIAIIDIDRGVHWREEGKNSYGWCARCGLKHPAVELRWRPDRVVFGEEKQGSWECRTCYARAGKYDVLGVSINGK